MSNTSILYKIFRVWHVAQLVTCLLHKHEDLTSDTQLPRKKVGTAASLELAGHSLAKSVYPRISERLSQNTQWREWLRKTTDPLWPPYAQVLFMHANTFLTDSYIYILPPNHPSPPITTVQYKLWATTDDLQIFIRSTTLNPMQSLGLFGRWSSHYWVLLFIRQFFLWCISHQINGFATMEADRGTHPHLSP